MRRRLPVLAAAALLVAIVLVPSPAFAVRRLALSSGSFKFDVAAGKSVEGEVVVINDGDEPIKVMVYTADQSVSDKGAVTYNIPNRTDLANGNQPSAWMRVFMPEDSKAVGNIPYLEMAPKQRIPIKFSAQVPNAAPPGDHNVMLFFEMFSGDPSAAGAGAQVSGRIGSRLQLRVAGDVVEKLDVLRFAVPAFVTQNGVPAVFTVQNLGNVDQRIVTSMKLLDRNGDAVAEAKPINNRLIFAGKNAEASATLAASRQLFGQYTVRLDVVSVNEEGQPVGGGKNTLIERRNVWFVPLWAILVVALLLAAIVFRVVWGAGRKSAMRRNAKQAAASAGAPPGQAGEPAAESDSRSA